jgi:hypothetical protein
MKHLRFINDTILEYNCLHYGEDHLASVDEVIKVITADLFKMGLSLNDLPKYKIVLDATGEGLHYTAAKKLLEFLKNNTIDLMFVASAIEHTPNNYNIISAPALMANHRDLLHKTQDIVFIKEIKTKFSSLTRIPKPERAYLLSGILRVTSSIVCSFGCFEGPVHLSTRYQHLFDADVKLPLCIDGTVMHNDDQIATVAYHSLFDIVHETFVTNPSIFITEKTFKALLFKSIPIISGVSGIVAELRFLGFDMFDDIVNHSYDDERNVGTRQDMIVQEVSRLENSYSLNQCKELYNSLEARLESNRLLVHKLYNDTNATVRKTIEEFVQRSA